VNTTAPVSAWRTPRELALARSQDCTAPAKIFLTFASRSTSRASRSGAGRQGQHPVPVGGDGQDALHQVQRDRVHLR
jgi:hypothetical protein